MLYVEPLKTKKGDDVLKAMKRIIKKLPKKAKYLTSDLGSEYIYKHFQKFLHSQAWFSTYTHSVICERMIGTLMQKIIRYIAHTNSNQFVPSLQNLVSSINATKSRSTGFAPKDINKENYFLAFRNMYKKELENGIPTPVPKYKKDDRVGFSLVKTAHEKG